MSKKKANGEGTISKRGDGRYMGRYVVDGKRYTVYGKTHEEVRVKLNERQNQVIKQVHVAETKGSFGQWLREWLVTYALPAVKQSTYISYEGYVRLHLEPELGKIKLTALTNQQLQTFFNKKNRGTSAKKGLSPKTLKNIYNMLDSLGIPHNKQTPLFCTPLGTFYDPRTYEDLFKRTLKTADLEDINFHALRHTFATRALENNMDIETLSSILGHTQPSTTLNMYGHALPNHKRKCMDRMGDLYGTNVDTNAGQIYCSA